MIKLTWTFFLFGLLFGSGPCLASCGPLLLTYISGSGKNILSGLLAYILFSLGRIFAYLLIACLFIILGNFVTQRLVGEYSKIASVTGGSFIIIVGIMMILGKQNNLLIHSGNSNFLVKLFGGLEKGLLERDKKTVFTLGLVTGILPCAPLISLFSYIGLSFKGWFEGLTCSLSFGLGTFFSPLILLALLAGALSGSVAKRNYYRVFSIICGLIILFLGVNLILRSL